MKQYLKEIDVFSSERERTCTGWTRLYQKYIKWIPHENRRNRLWKYWIFEE